MKDKKRVATVGSAGFTRDDDTILADGTLLLGAAIFESGRGGIARVARMTAQSLIADGYDLEMLSLLDNQSVKFGSHLTQSVRGSKLRFVARCRIAMLKRRHFIYDSAGIARAHGSLFGLRRPYGVWMHGIEVWHGLRPATRAVLDNANLCILNSTFTLNRYREMHGDLPATQVCWLATEEDEPPAFAPNFTGPPTVTIIARIDNTENYKGHKELIASWPSVVSAVSDARLLIVGDGPGLENLKALVRASPAAHSIEFTGFIREQDMPSLWQRTHVFAMPSRNEGFGIVYAEAMRYGVPVVASVHDAGQEINVHEKTGFNVNLDQVGDLEESLITLLRSPNLVSTMGQAGYERWNTQFRQTMFRRRLTPIIANFVRTCT